MILRSSAIALSLLALSACGSLPDDPATDAPTDAVSQIPPPAVAVQQFVDTVSASDLYETEAGKLAQAKGSSQTVKDFGAMMVKDHAVSTSNLRAAVAAGNPELMLAPQLTSEQQAKLDQLKAASGERFDDLYAMQQVGAHEDALALLQDYGTTGTDGALRGFAGKAAPVVEHHLAAARKLP